MADYSRDEVTVSFGATSALQDPDIERTFVETPSSPVEYIHRKVTAATGGGTSVTLSDFTTIVELFVKNHDDTNYVVGTYRELGDAAAANRTFKLAAGQWLKLVNVSPGTALTLAANTADCKCELVAIGT
jgi:hypothetical protein